MSNDNRLGILLYIIAFGFLVVSIPSVLVTTGHLDLDLYTQNEAVYELPHNGTWFDNHTYRSNVDENSEGHLVIGNTTTGTKKVRTGIYETENVAGDDRERITVDSIDVNMTKLDPEDARIIVRTSDNDFNTVLEEQTLHLKNKTYTYRPEAFQHEYDNARIRIRMNTTSDGYTPNVKHLRVYTTEYNAAYGFVNDNVRNLIMLLVIAATILYALWVVALGEE